MKEGDLVLVTVENVTNTVTSVRLESGEEGTIVSSEIAPGRIKHMRQYVVPNKKVVCKILNISNGHIHLSLRRVTSKEKKDVLERYKQQQALNVGFKQLFGDRAEEIKKKIVDNFGSLHNFIVSARENESIINDYIPKEKHDAIKKLLSKRKNLEISYDIRMKCLEDDGLIRIKKILEIDNSKISIIYMSAGHFKLKLAVEDFKEGKKKMAEIIQELEGRAKENHCEFFIEEEK
jgi:translation initiation factor 2 alpha subunit (eIF-2alpha)